jgi:hypothetical protein
MIMMQRFIEREEMEDMNNWKRTGMVFARTQGVSSIIGRYSQSGGECEVEDGGGTVWD